MNTCLCCPKEIPEDKHFCYRHWKLIPGTMRGPLLNSKKPETIAEKLRLCVEAIERFEGQLNPNGDRLYYVAGNYHLKTPTEAHEQLLKELLPDHKRMIPKNTTYELPSMADSDNYIRACEILVLIPLQGRYITSWQTKARWASVSVGASVKVLDESGILRDYVEEEYTYLSEEDEDKLVMSHKKGKAFVVCEEKWIDPEDTEVRALYESMTGTPLKFYGVNKHFITWKAKKGSLELYLSLSSDDLWAFKNLSVDSEPEELPPWENIMEDYRDFKLVDNSQKITYRMGE